MNFRPESGYDIAVKTLKGFGLPIRDKDLPPKPLAPEPNASGYLLPSLLRTSPVHTPSQSQEQVTIANYRHNYVPQYSKPQLH